MATQMQYAREGKITDAMRLVAEAEMLDAETIRERVARGTVAICAHVNHAGLKPAGVGEGLRTTLHCGLTLEAVRNLREEGRVMDVVSRGGSFITGWMLYNEKENPLYTHFDDILDICEKYDSTISLGDGLRPGCLADATDRAQITELVNLGALVDRAWKRGVQVMVEGPGRRLPVLCDARRAPLPADAGGRARRRDHKPHCRACGGHRQGRARRGGMGQEDGRSAQGARLGRTARARHRSRACTRAPRGEKRRRRRRLLHVRRLLRGRNHPEVFR